MDREFYMREALSLAREAFDHGEVPVGCVIADGSGNIIARGRNMREEKRQTLSHAECEAITAACANRGDWRLEDCSLYVTLEPCPMCAGAIINARIGTVVYGAKDENMGACAGVLNLFEERFGFRPAVYAGVLGDECAALMAEFFRRLRR